MAGRARQMLMGKRYGIINNLYSRFFYFIKRTQNKWNTRRELNKGIVLEGNSKIGIHHSAVLTLSNSKIIVHNGSLKIGIDFGYFDGGIYDPGKDSCRITLTNSTLEIFGNVTLFPGVVIFAMNAKVIIRNNTIINGGSQIIALIGIEIGEDCLLASGTLIRDNDGHDLSTREAKEEGKSPKVIIGNHCWFGQRTMVLKGVRIEDNSIIAAGAIVSKSVKSGSIVAGVPARVIKENATWKA